MIILGIDPGIATMGYGVIKFSSKRKTLKPSDIFKKSKALKCLDYGTIKTTPTLATSERLRKINNELTGLIKKYKPKVLVMESLYFFKNLKTVIPVSQAEGVILLTAAKKRIPVCQFTPLQVKRTITGYGRAEKKIVQKKINRLFCLKKIPKSDDAIDALAIALTYLFKREVRPSSKTS